MMVRTRILTVLFVGLFAGSSFAARTAGTYAVQGIIRDNAGDPFNGNLDIDVRIWTAAVGGVQVDLDGDNVITAADTIMLATVAVAVWP